LETNETRPWRKAYVKGALKIGFQSSCVFSADFEFQATLTPNPTTQGVGDHGADSEDECRSINER
jgi:hypothetical protein